MILFELDPNVVKAGWLPLILVLVLFGLIVLGYFSMRRQIAKISVPRRDELGTTPPATPPTDSGEPTTQP